MSTTTTAAPATTFAIDKAHSEIAFQVRHLITKVRGRFADFEGGVTFDEGTRAVLRHADHRRREHRHERGRPGQAPEVWGLLRRRSVSDAHVQEPARRPHRQRHLRCRG